MRDYVARVASETELERELGTDSDSRRRVRAIRDDVRHEAARRELEELKRSLAPREISGPRTPEVEIPTDAVPATA